MTWLRNLTLQSRSPRSSPAAGNDDRLLHEELAECRSQIEDLTATVRDMHMRSLAATIALKALLKHSPDAEALVDRYLAERPFERPLGVRMTHDETRVFIEQLEALVVRK